MNYLITGGTGLIGSVVCQKLLSQGDRVFVLSRDKRKVIEQCGPSVTGIENLYEISDMEVIDIVINLAGAPIADKSWSPKRKLILEQSRIQLTDSIIEWIKHRELKPHTLISGSAIGWYGNQGELELNENSPYADEYAHQLCADWEDAALSAEKMGVRVCIVRTGLVISPVGGFLKRLLLPFKLGLGGPIASGQQYMSWIHIQDISNLFIFLSEHQTARGIFNGTSPYPVSNEVFTKTLARVLKRPALFRIPARLLNSVLGEMAILLTGGQRVLPQHAQHLNFTFQYPELNQALKETLNKDH